ncbi:MAG: hypothetical protein ACI9H9_002463 [Pseudoalteromonas tetraodonis]|jgi:hypothetical protein|uniref:DUF4426 domain-containing protein n=1 Tax=Pseudoalteromonas TaxID=53246 RepID=UPI0001EF8DAC|nr:MULTISPECIES: DUF4426 domain-containing protein [unclassified Pseudoalteromonas]PHQ90529.1 MAG: DUF4426 domain-containing protein [Pseudoalteromonas sp.]ADT69499.1 hypothetical protein PSM_A2585 [Pseudoalteromonas sp. SM9913]KGK02976.1 protein of unknown function DUF4426 [Pseudoalteromonas sp. ND6B]MDN3401745.1 DUF4426 domain-containing protein [Pseudoalteromonas sp. APC 3213]MDN3406233.1 DUF4426 domain-containing protein [Pseudoalteromonas sp. APC 3218]|tara:strand:- start:1790 stop:2233 length:444 start_codon:yes stop_codon:yes gene_type:complete
MQRLIKFCFIACLALAFNAHSAQEQGAQYKELGPWQVHYIAFPSTFIQPQIAKTYGLERSGYKGIVNISILKNDTDKTAQKATLQGTARNLLGNKQSLNFKEVVEGDSVYYLAQVDYTNEEILRFEIEIQQGNQFQTLKFQQKFYVD